MTTIAYRDGVIAADTGMTASGLRVGYMTKIATNKAGDVVGCCGDAWWAQAFLRWFIGGEKGKPPVMNKEALSNAMIVRCTGEIVKVESENGKTNLHLFRSPFYALGSGRSEASGAMQVGATAEEAVRAAKALDESIYGEVETLRLGRVRTLRRAA